MITLADTPADATFRHELRTWLERHLPPGWLEGRRDVPHEEKARYEFFKDWQRTLYRGGWLAPEWPRQHGGRGASSREQMIYTEELARVDAPRILDNVGLGIVGPSLIGVGTPEQQRQFLPGILSAEAMWSLGFSEPNAGSDLASLRCKAERDGDHWVITGQKVWSSRAHLAKWCLLLARTDSSVAKHKGLTCLLVPLPSSGLTIVPTRQLTGESEFCELFFDGCRIPADHVLGPVNGGWAVIQTALGHERGTLWATEFKIRLEKGARSVAAMYNRLRRSTDVSAAQLARQRPRVVQAWIEATVFAAQTLRTLPKLEHATSPPPEAALQKLFGSEIEQRIEDLSLDLQGPYAQLYRDPRQLDPTDWQERYLYGRSVTISSGTSEIMRNLLAQRGLGLPR
ncbi:MAG: acyl-CoA dehydrogenase family protein [Deltaproteobacteria bacterium]|nr:acyl-CoA dehydrogenase family protein [Deltaproteobacteria bacterium]